MNKIFYILFTLFITFTSINSAHALDVIEASIVGDTGNTYDAQTADIDGDGDMDIYTVNYNQQNRLWLNNGDGTFVSANIAGDVGTNDTGAVLADIDGDGDIDIYVLSYVQNRLWINDGSENFTLSNIVGDNEQNVSALIEDFDDDGDVDIYVPDLDGLQNIFRINDGLGNGGASFAVTDIIAGDLGSSYEASAGDVDGDGDIDIHVANGFLEPLGEQNRLWINDGSGNFTASDIAGDMGESVESIMADIDDDGDLDIYVSNWDGQNYLWINDGDGNFVAAHIAGDEGESASARIGDVDNDGDMDIYVANYGQNILWLNDGSGNFVQDTIAGDLGNTEEVLLADFNGDGDLDFYVANYGQQNRLWFSDLPEPAPSSSSSPSRKKSSVRLVCKNEDARNYNPTPFGRHSENVCDYGDDRTDLCSIPMTTYFKRGDVSTLIIPLQSFLSEHLGINLNLDGIYGSQTEAAVSQFQMKYVSDILVPWELMDPTGNFYQSTRKKANDILGCSEGAVLLDNGVLLQ